jgi:hypothetical protein
MTIRSGHHVAGSLRAGRGGGRIGHAIRWLLFHMTKAIPHFSEACFNGGPGCRLDWDGRQERTGSLDSRPDALRNVRPIPPAKVASSSMTRPHYVYRGFSGLKSVVPIAARREVTLIFKALGGFHGRPIIILTIVLSWKVTP